MATRNIVPRVTEEGNIGTNLKRWLKGWFKDIFVAGYLTDGNTSISIAELFQSGAGGYIEDEGVSSTSSATYQQKTRLDFVAPATGNYILNFSAECGNSNAGKQSEFQIQQGDTTVLENWFVTCGINGEYSLCSGMKRIALNAGQTYFWDLDYRATTNTCNIRRARLAIRKVV